MQKYCVAMLVGAMTTLALLAGCATGGAGEAAALPVKNAVRAAAQSLVVAYPDAPMTLEEAEDGMYVKLGAERIFFGPWGQCPEALPDDTQDAPLCASLRHAYPTGEGYRNPQRGFEPGRVRHQAFLKALYGKGPREVESQLAPVAFFGQTLLFSTRHGAHQALTRVVEKLTGIMEAYPASKAFVLPSGGTFAWRTIKNSPRLSAHSFGIAIDLNVNRGLYWLWSPSPGAVEKTRRDYPQSVVAAFESEGFIWGGKWYSFDFMHFEYRPELLLHPHPVASSPCVIHTP